MAMKAKCFAAIIMVCLLTSAAYSDRPDNAKPATLLPALVWNPHSLPSGDSLYQTLLRGDYESTITNDIALFVDSLLDYHLFVMAGISEYHEPELTWIEFQPIWPALHSFLDEGGDCFWEGAGAFYWFEVDSLYYYFPVLLMGLNGYIDYLVGSDISLFEGIDSLEYSGGRSLYLYHPGAPNSFDAILGPQRVGHLPVGVANSVGTTRTLVTNFSWARLNDSGLDTRVELAHCVMNWLSGAVAVEEPEPLPQTYSLTPPYPNPFNAQVTVEYALPNEAAVSLSVFDIQGRKVATLTEGTKPAGYHRLIWDAKGMPSGLYFVRLTAGEFAEARKMTLLK
jgi:hypothetical protein